MPKILITRPVPEVAVNLLKDKGYEVDTNESVVIPTREELLRMLNQKQYDGVLCLLTEKIDKEIFEAAPSVKIFANYATGFDNFDLESAKTMGVFVTNAPGDKTSIAVAEHTIALILSLSRRIVEADKFVKEGKYVGWSAMHFIGTDLFDKTLGLIGGGHIGEMVARFSKALGMKIIYTDVVRNQKMEQELGAEYFITTDEVLERSDIVSLHVPLLDSTKHLLNNERFSKMKPGSILINTARGPVIEEKALIDALRSKKIAGAALDVFEFEPKVSEELFDMPNVILTPHIASASVAARNQMAEIAALNLIDFFEGKIPRNKL